MKRLVRFLILVMAMVMTTASFVGCGRNEKQDDPNAIELRVSFQKDSAETQITSSLVRGFVEVQKAKGKSVKVTPIPIVAGEYNDTIVKMFKAKTLPDVVYTYDSYASLWASNGVFENLTPYFERDNFDFSKYDDNAFTAAKAFEGNIYYAPREYNHPVVYVNSEIMKKYNIDLKNYATDGWTWDDLMTISKAIRAGMDGERNKDYIYPLDSSISWEAVINPFVQSMGGSLFNAETGEVGFTDPKTKEAMALIDSMIVDKLIPDPRSASAGSAFLSGKAAMWITSRPKVSAALDGEIDLSFLPMPKVGTGKHYIAYGNTGYAISSISENKELAWEFLKYVMSEKGQEIFSETGNCIPIVLSMQNDENATWRKFLPGVNQDMFVRNDTSMKDFEYVLGAYARGYDPSKEREIYIKISEMIGELHNKIKKEGLDAFCDYAQGKVEGIL